MSCNTAFYWICCNSRLEDPELDLPLPRRDAAGARSMHPPAARSPGAEAPRAGGAAPGTMQLQQQQQQQQQMQGVLAKRGAGSDMWSDDEGEGLGDGELAGGDGAVVIGVGASAAATGAPAAGPKGSAAAAGKGAASTAATAGGAKLALGGGAAGAAVGSATIGSRAAAAATALAGAALAAPALDEPPPGRGLGGAAQEQEQEQEQEQQLGDALRLLHWDEPAAAAPKDGGGMAAAAAQPQPPQPSSAVAAMAALAAPAPELLRDEWPAGAPPRAAFLYASQTGNGMEVARRLRAEAARRGIAGDVTSLDGLGFAALAAGRAPVCVFVCSSTGDGDPPDNGASFFAKLLGQQPAGRLRGVRFALLGLGDSTYSRFLGAPRSLRARLVALGAEEFYGMGQADEAKGRAEAVDLWCSNLWGPLKDALLRAGGASGATAVAAHAIGGAAAAKSGVLTGAGVAAAAAAAAAEAHAQAAAATDQAKAKAMAEKVQAEGVAEKAMAEATAAQAAAAQVAPAQAAEATAAIDKARTEAAAQEAEAAERNADEQAAALVAAEELAGAQAAAAGGAEAAGLQAEEPAGEESPAAQPGATEDTASVKAATGAAEDVADADVAAAASSTADEAAAAAATAAAAPDEVAAEADALAAAAAAGPAATDEVEAEAAAAVAAPGPSATAEVEDKAAAAAAVPGPTATYEVETEAAAAAAAPGPAATYEAETEAATAAAAAGPAATDKVEAEAATAGAAAHPAATDEVEAEAKTDAAVAKAASAAASTEAETEAAAAAASVAHVPRVMMEMSLMSLGDDDGTGDIDGVGSGGGSGGSGTRPPSDHPRAGGGTHPSRLANEAGGAAGAWGSADGGTPAGLELAAGEACSEEGGLRQEVRSAAEGGPELLEPDTAADAGPALPLPALPRLELSFSVSPEVANHARARELSRPSLEQRSYRDPGGTYSAASPYWAQVVGARLLTASGCGREVVHCELDATGSDLPWGPGDSIAVLPQNDPELVGALLQRLGLDADAVFAVRPAADGSTSAAMLLPHVECPCTLRHAFTHFVDFMGAPRKGLLHLLAEHCPGAAEKRELLQLASEAGRDGYGCDAAARPTLLDLLERFPGCSPPAGALLDELTPLAPRSYSLSSAPTGPSGPGRLEFAFAVVQLQPPSGRARLGVATGWLRRLLEPWLAAGGAAPPAEAWVPIFLHKASAFAPPEDASAPLVMVGPGTGAAPFRGFLQARHAAASAAAVGHGEAWLYAGCRRRGEDFVYGADFEAYEAAGDLARLRVAASREGEKRVHVQHLLRQDGAALAAMLMRRGVRLYVCGDGAGMAHDVHAALLAVLQAHVGLSDEEAAEELASMEGAGTYVREVWSL